MEEFTDPGQTLQKMKNAFPGTGATALQDKRPGAGCHCGDFAVGVNDFSDSRGAAPIVGKCFSPGGLLTTTQVVGNKASVSV